jgi:iron complex outermembrane receptor protein
MPRSTLFRGIFAWALALVALPSFAQQTLPTIEVGKQRATAPRQHARTGGVEHRARTAQTGGGERHGRPAPAPAEPQAPAPAAPAQEAGSPYAGLPASSTAQLTQQSGDRYSGYDAQKAVSAKIDAPIMQTPISVKVVTRETLDDQPAFNISESIVSNVSGVAMMPSGCSFEQNMVVRGFPTGSVQIAQVYRNGLLDPNEFCPSTANIQAVEVVKGPASVLYGRSEPGGLIDFVTKQPLETPYYSLTEQAGGFGTTRTFLDATGPLTSDKTWLYRVDAEVSREGSFMNYVWSQRNFGSGVLTYHPTEQFKANLRAEYQDSTNIDAQPNFPAYGNQPAPIPINTYLEDISFTGANPDQSLKRYVNFDWSYDLDKDWNITQRFAYNNSRNMTTNNFFACLNNPPYPDNAGGPCTYNATTGNPVPLGTGWNQAYWAPDVARSITGNIELKGKFTTGFFEHAGLVGIDHLDFNDVDNGFESYVPTQINIFAPLYGNGGLAYSATNAFAGYGQAPFNCFGGLGYQCSAYAAIKKQEWQGFYAQDLISFADDKFHVLLGGRWDIASASTGSGVGSLSPYFNDALTLANLPGSAFGNYGTTKDKFFSPRVGVVFQPLPWFSVYGSYTESYGLNNGLDAATSQPLPSQSAIQWEGGVKAEFFDKKLTATAAFFDINKHNIATVDPSNPAGAFYDLLSARSHGAELDITGRIDRNWSVIANYSHVDNRVTKGTSELSLIQSSNRNCPTSDPLDLCNDAPFAGNRYPGVPDNTGNLWVKYDADGAFRGLTGAIGVSRVGMAWGDFANSFMIPAYTLVKLMGGYRFQVGKTWVTTQVNVDNLTNERYFYGWNPFFSNRFSLTPGAPRSVLGTLRLEL